jgi:hypothetical protein
MDMAERFVQEYTNEGFNINLLKPSGNFTYDHV